MMVHTSISASPGHWIVVPGAPDWLTPVGHIMYTSEGMPTGLHLTGVDRESLQELHAELGRCLESLERTFPAMAELAD